MDETGKKMTKQIHFTLPYSLKYEARIQFLCVVHHAGQHNISDCKHVLLLFGVPLRHLNGWLALIKKVPRDVISVKCSLTNLRILGMQVQVYITRMIV